MYLFILHILGSCCYSRNPRNTGGSGGSGNCVSSALAARLCTHLQREKHVNIKCQRSETQDSSTLRQDSKAEIQQTKRQIKAVEGQQIRGWKELWARRSSRMPSAGHGLLHRAGREAKVPTTSRAEPGHFPPGCKQAADGSSTVMEEPSQATALPKRQRATAEAGHSLRAALGLLPPCSRACSWDLHPPL